MKKLLFSWKELIATFWFVPVLIILGAISLAILLLYLDSQFDFEGSQLIFLAGSAESARSILTTISAAMIGVAGTVFSITLVALTLASSQFGSRLVKNFMYDRLNQVVLGSYIATFMYCLIVLNTIKQTGDVSFIPSLSVLVALLITLVNIVLLIVFIHHIAVSIQADKVISDISDSLAKNISVLFPEKIGEDWEEEKQRDDDAIRSSYQHTFAIQAPVTGYLQYVDGSTLMRLCRETDGLIELHCRPGDYIVRGVELGTVWSNEVVEDEFIKKTRKQFIVGETRILQQDSEYAIHQMVEIALRALSPGINDPYTAIACIDNLTAAMSQLAGVTFPSKYRHDEDGELRVIADVATYEGMLDAAFNQIRQFSAGSPSVAIRLIEALITINKFAKSQKYKAAIEKHARMVVSIAKDSFSEPNDLKDLQSRSRELISELGEQ